MILKRSHQKWLIFVNLQIYFTLSSLVFVQCDGLLSFVEDFASTHSYRRNFSRSLHNRFEHLEFLKDEESPLNVRRLIRPPQTTTSNSPSISSAPNRQGNYDEWGSQPANNAYNNNNSNGYSGNPYPSDINRDPLWNSNNRFTNRFDRFFNKIPSFLYTTYSTHAYDSSFTTTRPPYYKPASNYKPTNSINSKPGHAAVSSNVRPVNVRPNYTSNSRPNSSSAYGSSSYGNNRYSRYNAECACKRKTQGGYTYVASTTSVPSPATPASSNAPSSTTRRPLIRHGRSTSLTRESRTNDKDKDINTRIVNGTVADYYRFPWTVSLQRGRAIDDKYTNGSHYCGGTLISPSYVLTAGHCLSDFKPKKVIVAYGSGDRTKMKHFAEVDQWFLHPQYSGWPKYLNDIALVKLREPVQLDGSIKPACLHSSYSTRLRNEFDAVGWGRLGSDEEFPVQLQKSKFDYIGTTDCKHRWDKEDDHPDITNKNLCVYNPSTDICGGDSGSPLMNVAEDNVYYVVGVASFTNYCEKTQPAVYVRVYPYIDWIVSVVKNFC